MTDDRRPLYWRLQGEEIVPCTMLENIEDHRQRTKVIQQHGPNADPWRVRHSGFGDISVSTVFLGLAHGYVPSTGAPIVFETHVFGGPLDDEQQRYSSWRAAVNGHYRMIERIQFELLQEESRGAVRERREQRPKAAVVNISRARKIRVRKKDGK